MNDTHSRWWGFATLVLALLVTVAACSLETPGKDSAGEGTSTAGTTAGSPAAPEVIAVHEDVDYYGACGNEVLDLEGEKFYPLLEDEEVDVTRYGSGMGVHISMVPMPSPGDDTGTLTVYSDGYARFLSDSGKFDIWLTTQSRTYNWLC